jgi:hypothetical protein
MSTIMIDTSKQPVIIVTFPDEYDDVEWYKYVKSLVSISTTWKEVVIVNVIDGQLPTATQRARVIEVLKPKIDAAERSIRGIAFVTKKHALVRGVLSVLTWTSGKRFNTAVFSDREEALVWAVAQTSKS